MDLPVDVPTLTDMGYSIDRCNKALLAADGDFNQALDHLLSGAPTPNQEESSSCSTIKKAGPSTQPPQEAPSKSDDDRGQLCVCQEGHTTHDMIQCSTCTRWFHHACAHIPTSTIPSPPGRGRFTCHFELLPTVAPLNRAGEKFNELESRSLFLSVKRFSPIGKNFWSNVSTYMRAEFNISRSSNSCKFDWLRNSSAVWGWDERVSRQLDEEDMVERKKLWRCVEEGKKPGFLAWRAIGLGSGSGGRGKKRRVEVEMESEDRDEAEGPVVKKRRDLQSKVPVPQEAHFEASMARQQVEASSSPTSIAESCLTPVPGTTPLLPLLCAPQLWAFPFAIVPLPIYHPTRILERIAYYPLTHSTPIESEIEKSTYEQLVEHRKWVAKMLGEKENQDTELCEQMGWLPWE